MGVVDPGQNIFRFIQSRKINFRMNFLIIYTKCPLYSPRSSERPFLEIYSYILAVRYAQI